MSDDLPPMPEEGEGVMGLLEVDPSPVEVTPIEFRDDYFSDTESQSKSRAPTRTSTLGLGNHGPAYYRTYISFQYIMLCKRHRLTHSDSHKSSKVLLLRFHGVCVITYYEHLDNTTPHTLRPRIEPLFAPHASFLPVCPYRTIAYCDTFGRTRGLWNCITFI